MLGSLETGEAGEEDGSGAEGKLNHDQLLQIQTKQHDFVSKTKVDAWLLLVEQVMVHINLAENQTVIFYQ